MSEDESGGGSKSSVLTGTGADPCEVVFTRIINAPRELVFQAFTDPKHLARWWGPRGMTNPVCEVDLRPGGAFRIIMRAEDGGEYPCRGVFHEIVEPERLVFTVGAYDHPAQWQEQLASLGGKAESELDVQQVWTVTLEEENVRTKLTVRNRFGSVAVRDAALEMGHAEGTSQSLDRLVELVESPAADREIRLTRVIHAPREVVFKAWTDPQHLVHWWGPDGFTVTIFEMDVRPGGVWRFVMHGPDGVDYQNRIEYVEIRSPERLVYDHVSGPKFRMSVDFAAQGNKTELAIQMLFESAELRAQVIRQFGAEEGLKQTVGRLAEYLVTL